MLTQNSTVPVANIKLVAFDRVKDLAAGASQTVNLTVNPAQMTVSNASICY
jgi:hypothetical protein